MRKSISVVVCYSCLLTVGCADKKQIAERRSKEVEEWKSDKNMLVPDWYRAEYDFSTELGGLWGDGASGNKLAWKMLGLHLILTMVATMIVVPRLNASDKTGNGEKPSGGEQNALDGWWVFYGLSQFVLLVLSVAVWLLAGIVVPIFSSGSYIPFSFIGFLLMVAGWVAAVSVGAVLFIHSVAWSKSGEKVGGGSRQSNLSPPNVINVAAIQPVDGRQQDVTVVKTMTATRRGRMLRAMMKAGFVAVVSAIGAKLGGWIGGVLVFVISAGVSAYFELPHSDDSDQLQLPGGDH